MSKKYFGTDGIRGRAGQHPMTAEFAVRLAMAVGQYFSTRAGRHRVVIGKDTRRSGYMLENALTAGVTAASLRSPPCWKCTSKRGCWRSGAWGAAMLGWIPAPTTCCS